VTGKYCGSSLSVERFWFIFILLLFVCLCFFCSGSISNLRFAIYPLRFVFVYVNAVVSYLSVASVCVSEVQLVLT